MKVVLRDLKTGWYFAGQKLWVERLDGAATFDSAKEAAAAAWDSRGQDVAVVLKYHNPESEPVSNPAYCARPPKWEPRLPVGASPLLDQIKSL